VYVVAYTSPELGVSVATPFGSLYEIVAGMSVLLASRSSNVDVVRVAGSIASLKVAVTAAPTTTLDDDAAGETTVTLGAAESGAAPRDMSA
jgi:hypothetical protein